MLRSLFLAKNQLKKIKTPFPYLPSLYHLNIAENQITQVEELDKIGRLKSIKSLTITANPFADALGEEMKMEILMRFGYFERINEEEIKKNDRVDAENLKVSK
jgi:Leucine-rich repeat (LRR) protein